MYTRANSTFNFIPSLYSRKEYAIITCILYQISCSDKMSNNVKNIDMRKPNSYFPLVFTRHIKLQENETS